MKKRTKHTTDTKTFLNRYRHNLFMGLCLLFLAVSMILSGCDINDSDDDEGPPSEYDQQIEELRQAVEPFHDFEQAQAAGYSIPVPDNPEECLDHPTLGAMGFHYGKGDLIPNDTLEVTKPEVLIYEPKADGTVEFVSVEYVVPFSVRGEEESPPILFGEEFRQNERFQVWELHAWVGKDNPAGMFPDWNPNVSCEHADKWINR